MNQSTKKPSDAKQQDKPVKSGKIGADPLPESALDKASGGLLHRPLAHEVKETLRRK
jgi:hypothetical protein